MTPYAFAFLVFNKYLGLRFFRLLIAALLPFFYTKSLHVRDLPIGSVTAVTVKDKRLMIIFG